MADFCGFAGEKCPVGRKNVRFLCVGVGDKCKKSVMGLIFLLLLIIFVIYQKRYCMFSQDYKINIQACDGCACRCVLGCETTNVNGCNVFFPAINGNRVSIWTDEDGVLQNCGYQKSAPQACAQARKIAKTCDFYKTGVMPESGAVKCSLCSLPVLEKCDLFWHPYGDEKGRFLCSVSGDCCRCGAEPSCHVGNTPGDALKKMRTYIAKSCELAQMSR